jgi:hypothetical protein
MDVLWRRSKEKVIDGCVQAAPRRRNGDGNRDLLDGAFGGNGGCYLSDWTDNHDGFEGESAVLSIVLMYLVLGTLLLARM